MWRQTRVAAGSVCVFVVVMVSTGVKSFDLVGGAKGLATLAPLLRSPAIAALYGRPYGVNTAGGFMQWKIGMYLALAVTIWSALVATRLTRAAEDDGSWDLLVSSRVTHGRATRSAAMILAALAAGVGTTATITLVVAGHGDVSSVFYGLDLALVTMVTAAAGLVCAQVVAPRRRASSWAVSIVGGAFVLRMVADGVTRWSWLRWATPFGWYEEVQSFAAQRWWVLGLFGVTLCLAGLAVRVLLAHRDVGTGALATSDLVSRESFLVRSPLALAVKERRTLVVTWSIVMALCLALMGLLIRPLVDFARENAHYTEMLQRYGYGAVVTAAGFIGEMDLFVSLALSFFVLTSLHQLVSDETSGRLDVVLATGPSRTKWASATIIVSLAGALALTLVGAIAFYLGDLASGGQVSVVPFLSGGLSALVVVLAVAGVAVLLHGWLPRVAFPLASGLVIVAFFDSAFGPALGWPSALVALSPFHAVPLVPFEPWRPVVVVVLALVGAALGAVGLLRYARRDLLSA